MITANDTNFVEIEHQVKLTDIAKEAVQYLYKEMYCLKICQLIVICIHTDAEEESSVSTINNLQRSKFNKVGLVFLVSRSYESVYLSFQLDLLLILALFSLRDACRLREHLTLYGAYHFANLVLPLEVSAANKPSTGWY